MYITKSDTMYYPDYSPSPLLWLAIQSSIESVELPNEVFFPFLPIYFFLAFHFFQYCHTQVRYAMSWGVKVFPSLSVIIVADISSVFCQAEFHYPLCFSNISTSCFIFILQNIFFTPAPPQCTTHCQYQSIPSTAHIKEV